MLVLEIEVLLQTYNGETFESRGIAVSAAPPRVASLTILDRSRRDAGDTALKETRYRLPIAVVVVAVGSAVYARYQLLGLGRVTMEGRGVSGEDSINPKARSRSRVLDPRLTHSSTANALFA